MFEKIKGIIATIKSKLPYAKEYFIERIKEPSTWRGIILLFVAFGCNISPEQQEAIITVGLTIVGFIGAVTRG